MQTFNEIVFYFGLVGTSIATFILLLVQLNKDLVDNNTNRFAKITAILGAILILISIFTGVNAHLDANNQEDSANVYHQRYDSLLYSNLDSTHKSIDSTRKVIHITDSILGQSLNIITKEQQLLQFEDSTRKSLNSQIIASKDALAKITNDIKDFQTGKTTYCYVTFHHSITIAQKSKTQKQINGGEFDLNGSGNGNIDYLVIDAIDNGTTKQHKTLPPNSLEFFALTNMHENIEKVSNPSRINKDIYWPLFTAHPIKFDSTRDYLFTFILKSARQQAEEHMKIVYVNGGWENAFELKVTGINQPLISYSYNYPNKQKKEFQYFPKFRQIF